MRRSSSSSVFHNSMFLTLSLAAWLLQALPVAQGSHPERNWVAEFKRFGVGKADWPEYPYQKTTDEGQKWVRRSLRVKPTILQAESSAKHAWEEGVKYTSMLNTVNSGAQSIEKMAAGAQKRIADESDAVFQHYVGKAHDEVEGREEDQEEDEQDDKQQEGGEDA
mmetsp:Transcript_30685/g.46347  ORF Transcript_30685/g.46347 Transcript_30685/m.46347 type:complete len:165 (-) Transcript_30685:183-677(-)